MSRIVSALDRMVKWGAWLGAVALVLMFALGLSEIVLREVFLFSLPISLEYTGYLVAFAFLWGSGWTFRQGGHVRLSLLKLSPKAAKNLDIFGHLIALALSLALALGLVRWALGSLKLGSVSYFPSATALWVPQMLLAIGPVLLVLAALAGLLEAWKGKGP